MGISFKSVTSTALVALMGSLRTEVRKILVVVHSVLLASTGWPLPKAVPAGSLGGSCSSGSGVVAALRSGARRSAGLCAGFTGISSPLQNYSAVSVLLF